MKILFFGDIVGRPGREVLKETLPRVQKKYKADLVLANGENLAHGKGVTEKALKEALEAGIDLVTTGDHAFDKKGSLDLYEGAKYPILRPLNFAWKAPGYGSKVINCGIWSLLVVNLVGQVFMKQQFESPFRYIEELLEDYSLGQGVNGILIDLHAEATSEKMALGYYLDGRVSAVLGTHTHVQTADERILPKDTAFITDVGMVGPVNSILGLDKDLILKQFLTQRPQVAEIAEGPVIVNGVFLEIDSKRGLAKKIERISEVVE